MLNGFFYIDLHCSRRSVLVCDINPKMLEVGQNRTQTMLTPEQRNRISWLEGDAENLHSIPDNTFDAYTIAFGIRNCVHVDKVKGMRNTKNVVQTSDNVNYKLQYNATSYNLQLLANSN